MIRDMKRYNEDLKAIKMAAADTIVRDYDIEFRTRCHLYDGAECHHVSSEGVRSRIDNECNKFIISYTYDNDISTSSGMGDETEDVLFGELSIDIMLHKVKNALKVAYSAPAFIGNENERPIDDDGMWENNYKKIPELLIVKINGNTIVTVEFGRE